MKANSMAEMTILFDICLKVQEHLYFPFHILIL